jgi:hypothetical protein
MRIGEDGERLAPPATLPVTLVFPTYPFCSAGAYSRTTGRKEGSRSTAKHGANNGRRLWRCANGETDPSPSSAAASGDRRPAVIYRPKAPRPYRHALAAPVTRCSRDTRRRHIQ